MFILLQKAYEEANDYVRLKAGKLEWLAAKVEAYAQQQDVVTETIERGGEVEMEEADWLRRSFGEDFGHVGSRTMRAATPSSPPPQIGRIAANRSGIRVARSHVPKPPLERPVR